MGLAEAERTSRVRGPDLGLSNRGCRKTHCRHARRHRGGHDGQHRAQPARPVIVQRSAPERMLAGSPCLTVANVAPQRDSLLHGLVKGGAFKAASLYYARNAIAFLWKVNRDS